MSDPFAPRTLAKKNKKGLSIGAAAKSAAPRSNRDSVVDKLQNLELGVEYQLQLRHEDFEILGELGSGNGGTVSKVLHKTHKMVMARKVGSSIIVIEALNEA